MAFFKYGGKMNKDIGTKRWTVLAGALIVQIVLGTVYAFSVFVKPLQMEFGWDRTTTQMAFSFALLSFAITMIPAGRLQDRIGPRKVASIGGILLGLSFLLGALIVSKSQPWTLYLTYGILGGAGIGFAYVCPIASAMKWFPDKKGLVTGLSVAGFGAGALFFAGPASTLLLPPRKRSRGNGFIKCASCSTRRITGRRIWCWMEDIFCPSWHYKRCPGCVGVNAPQQPACRLETSRVECKGPAEEHFEGDRMEGDVEHSHLLHAVADIYFRGNIRPDGNRPVETPYGQYPQRQVLCS